MIVVQRIHDYCADNTFAMDSHVVWWPVIVSSSMPSRNLRWGKCEFTTTVPRGWTWFPVPVSQLRKCHKEDMVPPVHISPYSLGWLLLNSRSVLSYLPWSIKLSFMTPSFGSADLFCWVDVCRSYISSCCHFDVSTYNSTPKQACHMILSLIKTFDCSQNISTSMVLAQNGVWWSVNVRDIVLGHLRTIEVH